MNIHNESWLKEQYESIPFTDRSYFMFISMKIKHFRLMNREFGRCYGDDLILAVYQCLVDTIKTDGFVAHIHGGMFNIIIRVPQKNPDDLTLLKWTTEFGKAIYFMEDARYHQCIYCGFGIYLLEAEPVDFYIAQYNADVARSESNENQYVVSHVEIYGQTYFEPGLHLPDYRKMLQPALEKGHIHMYLQPKVDLKTGKVTSAEALMRWIDPEKGMLSITDFFDTLEECGQTNLIDMFIFKEACRHILKWKEKYGKTIQLSVNLSKTTFVYPFFLEEYNAVHEQYPCDRDCLELELLESIILNQVSRVKEVGKQIREQGFRCGLDDFGSGYSSYSVLSQTPLNTLKIDRSLFSDYRNPKELTLIRHIIETGHEMGLQVVAEGVEEASYVKILRDYHCDFIQGFVFYRPMPVAAFEQKFIINDETIVF